MLITVNLAIGAIGSEQGFGQMYQETLYYVEGKVSVLIWKEHGIRKPLEIVVIKNTGTEGKTNAFINDTLFQQILSFTCLDR